MDLSVQLNALMSETESCHDKGLGLVIGVMIPFQIDYCGTWLRTGLPAVLLFTTRMYYAFHKESFFHYTHCYLD